MFRTDQQRAVKDAVLFLQAGYIERLHPLFRETPPRRLIIDIHDRHVRGQGYVQNYTHRVCHRGSDKALKGPFDSGVVLMTHERDYALCIRNICEAIRGLRFPQDLSTNSNRFSLDLASGEIFNFQTKPEALIGPIRPDLGALLTPRAGDVMEQLAGDVSNFTANFLRNEAVSVARQLGGKAKAIGNGVRGLPDGTVLKINYRWIVVPFKNGPIDDYEYDFTIENAAGPFDEITETRLHQAAGDMKEGVEQVLRDLQELAKGGDFRLTPGSRGHITVDLNAGTITQFEHMSCVSGKWQTIQTEDLFESEESGPAPM